MIKLTKKVKQFRREHAQTMVEFALVFPIILLITYGIMELGRAVFIYAEITNAAREGARYGIATGDDPGTSPKIPYFANCAGIETAARRITFAIPQDEINVTIKFDNGPAQSLIINCPPGKDANGDYVIKQGYRIVVTVQYFFTPVLGSFLGFDGFDIVSTNYRTLLMTIKYDNGYP